MDNVVDLGAWRQTRDETEQAGEPDIRRLELAVSRLDAAASARLEEGRLEATIETELLAILGALAADLVDEAAARAERLSKRLASGSGSVG
jgi:hypothetical protein